IWDSMLRQLPRRAALWRTARMPPSHLSNRRSATTRISPNRFGDRMASDRPVRVMILADGTRPDMRDAVDRLRGTIEKYVQVAAVSFDFSAPLPELDAEMAIVFGGDGSILRAARQMGDHQRPVLGVNLGRLGFLAALQPEQLEHALPEIAA